MGRDQPSGLFSDILHRHPLPHSCLAAVLFHHALFLGFGPAIFLLASFHRGHGFFHGSPLLLVFGVHTGADSGKGWAFFLLLVIFHVRSKYGGAENN